MLPNDIDQTMISAVTLILQLIDIDENRFLDLEPPTGPPPPGIFCTIIFETPRSPEHFVKVCHLASGALGSYRGQRSSSAVLHMRYK